MNSSLTVALTGQLSFVLIAAAVFSLPVSLALLWQYRRAVIKSMMRREANTEPSASVVAPATPRDNKTNLDLALLEGRSGKVWSPISEALLQQSARGPLLDAAIYAAAGCLFAALFTLVFLLANDLQFSPFRALTLFWNYLWPAVVVLYLVLPSTRDRKWIAAGYFSVFALVTAINVARNESLTVAQVLTLWRITNGLPTVLLLLFLHKRIRAVGPLVLSFMLIALVGANVALSLVGRSEASVRAALALAAKFGLGGHGAFWAVPLVGFVLFALLGWLAVAWIRGRYRAKRTNDQVITVDAVWLLFAVANSVDLVFEGWAWIFTGLLAFAVAKLVTRIGYSLSARGAPAADGGLLVLRVFSLGKKSERLFEQLAGRWRHIGSIQMIAGPDLVNSNIEPDEFLDFVAGQLARRFIDGPQAMSRRFSEMDTRPDIYGRYRVNEFFCHDDTWREVLRRLVETSYVVMMDLRGFCKTNLGCAYELHALIELAPLERLVLVIDETSDLSLLRDVLHNAWDSVGKDSANGEKIDPRVNILRLGTRSSDIEDLMEALCRAAGSHALPRGGPEGNAQRLAPICADAPAP